MEAAGGDREVVDRHEERAPSRRSGGLGRVVRFESLTEAVRNKFAAKAKLIPLNMKALEAGRKAAEGE